MMLLGLTACSSTNGPVRADDQVTVVWNRVADPHEACQEVSGRREIFRIHGCARWNERDAQGRRQCSIYTRPPRNEHDKETFVTLGHELMHCFDAQWHDRWGRMTEEALKRQSAAVSRSQSAASGGSQPASLERKQAAAVAADEPRRF